MKNNSIKYVMGMFAIIGTLLVSAATLPDITQRSMLVQAQSSEHASMDMNMTSAAQAQNHIHLQKDHLS